VSPTYFEEREPRDIPRREESALDRWHGRKLPSSIPTQPQAVAPIQRRRVRLGEKTPPRQTETPGARLGEEKTEDTGGI
jgi:hypothetical protein